MHEIVKKHTGNMDPYSEVKLKDISAAKKCMPFIEEYIELAGDKLYAALKVSATGNIMDSALFNGLDIEACLKKELEDPFLICDIKELMKDLSNARTILMIGDNSGEAVFDLLLLKYLHSDHKMYYAVRETPVINDVTTKEAKLAGIDKYAAVISTGNSSPGAIVSGFSEKFKKIYDSADIILAKGQGNFEAMYYENKRIYFILKAKCDMIAEVLGTIKGGYVLRAGFMLHR
jgi:uncharacterized protein with ATP-grasp and redox domains